MSTNQNFANVADVGFKMQIYTFFFICSINLTEKNLSLHLKPYQVILSNHSFRLLCQNF